MESTRPQADQPAVLLPVLQLFMILAPTVANGFLMVYVLLGAVLEEPQKARWAAEALTVGIYTTAAIAGFCGLLFCYQRWRGHAATNPLAIMHLVQIAIAVVLLIALVLIRAY